MELQAIESEMIVLFLAIALGFAARKLHVFNETTDDALTTAVLDITLPCTIIGSVITRTTLPDAATIGYIFLFSFLAFLLTLAIAIIVPFFFGLDAARRGTYRFMLAFGNVGFIGFPVLNAIYGPEAILYGAIFNIPFNIFVFTVGIIMLSQSDTDANTLKLALKGLLSPTLIACFVAMFLALFNVTNTGIFGEAVETVGAMTTPAALLIVGSNLANVPLGTMLTHFRTYIMAAFKLLIIPMCVWLVFRSVITDPLLLGVLVVTSGMPVAINGTLLCKRYGGDLDTMLRGTFITTVLSIVTIPLIASVLL